MADPADATDVLGSPLFTVAPGCERLSLAGLVARLLVGPEVDSFPELAPEQRSYWWRFLVRCGAKAVHELDWTVAQATARDAGQLAGEIERVLRGLVPEAGWRLYQPDPAKAGFLQVPTPDGLVPGATGSKYRVKPISALTGALGEKNHERKADAIRALTPEQTVYALIEYQTAAIYGGAGNYGSQIMGSASGAGSGTPFMGAWVAGSHRQTFGHDVQAVLAAWPAVVASGLAGRVWALWAEPWSGAAGSSMPSRDLDPAFIPVARMVRLAALADGQVAGFWFQSTKCRRVADHTAVMVGDEPKGGGLLGDPFTTSVRDPQRKVRGVLGTGFTYAEVVSLLFGDDGKFEGPSPSVLALVEAGDTHRTDLTTVFEGVGYEQGKTVGFFRREVQLPAQGGTWLDNPAPVRATHAILLGHVKAVQSALRGAVRIVLSGEAKPRPSDAKKVAVPVAVLDERVDTVYLDFLFAAAACYAQQGADAAFDQPLVEWLSREATTVLRDALVAVPCNTNQRLERELRAERFLRTKLRALRHEAAPAADAEEEATG